jgi:hypothetical protein
MSRIQQTSTVSTHLACLSNAALTDLLENGQPMHAGIGGQSSLIYVDAVPVFVKKIPLTDLERLPQYFMSTANIFGLPLCYQYGVGSAGFGAWRELATHIMTSNWVIAGECDNFPIMYHWRILPTKGAKEHLNYWGDIEKYCQYWENSAAIRKRVENLNTASAHIALFLEYIPSNLHDWLSDQMTKAGESAEKALVFVDQQLQAINKHMKTHGLIHFDAHFENILTDGNQLYLSDFGLALSSKFDLSVEEIEFFKQHQSYDQACAAVNLLHGMITSFFPGEPWEMRLRDYLAGRLGELPPVMASMIKQHAPVALLMDEFFQQLQKDSKQTPFPLAHC